MKKFNYIFIILIWSLTATAAAENLIPPRKLSLREAVLLSLRYNPSVKNAEIQRIIDKFDLRVAQNQFELHYALTGNAGYADLDIAGSKDRFHQVVATPSIRKQTGMGTDIGLGYNNSYDGSHNIGRVTFNLKQPLMRGFGSDVVQSQLYNAYDRERINQLTLKNTIISTITLVVNDYREYLQQIYNFKITQLALKASIETVEKNKVRIHAGTMAESDNVQYEAQVASQRVAVIEAENSLSQSKQKLLSDIGLAPDTPIEIVTEILIDETPIINEEKSKELSIANNIDYQIALINRKINERALLVAKDNARVQLDFVLESTVGQGLTGKDISNASNIINGQNTTKSASLQLTVPIDDYKLKQSIISAKIALQKDDVTLKQKKWQLETNVINAITNIKIQKQRIELARKAKEYAENSLNIANQKLRYGRVSAFEVTSLQTSLINASLGEINAKIAYLNSLNNFYQLLGITLEIWGIEVRC